MKNLWNRVITFKINVLKKFLFFGKEKNLWNSLINFKIYVLKKFLFVSKETEVPPSGDSNHE